MRQTALCVLVKPVEGGEWQVCLGWKKHGFGKGKWTAGLGGKVEPGESPEEAARRELYEEVGVHAVALEQAGVINFRFEGRDELDFDSVIYLVREWQGVLSESDEIRPAWFDLNALPYEDMWHDTRLWVPMIFTGSQFRALFVYDSLQRFIRHDIQPLSAP